MYTCAALSGDAARKSVVAQMALDGLHHLLADNGPAGSQTVDGTTNIDPPTHRTYVSACSGSKEIVDLLIPSVGASHMGGARRDVPDTCGGIIPLLLAAGSDSARGRPRADDSRSRCAVAHTPAESGAASPRSLAVSILELSCLGETSAGAGNSLVATATCCCPSAALAHGTARRCVGPASCVCVVCGCSCSAFARKPESHLSVID